MGFFEKLSRVMNSDDVGYDDDDELFDDKGDYSFDDEPVQSAPAVSTSAPASKPAGRQAGAMGINSSSLELKVVKPERYDKATAQKIADHLLNRRTVVLNLEATNKEAARRLIDFLSGVAYSIDGYLQRVANGTYVVVPNNVDVSGEQLQEPKKPEDTDPFQG